MDYTKLYTAREANALYNKCRIRDNPFNYTLKGNLILNRKRIDMGSAHVQNVGYNSEITLLHCAASKAFLEPFAGGDAYDPDNPFAGVATKDMHTYICVQTLAEIFIGLEDKLKGSREMECVVKYIVALDSVRSCVNESFYLTTHLLGTTDCEYEALQTMQPLKNALETDTQLPMCTGPNSISTVAINSAELSKAASSIVPIAKNALATMEVLWAYFEDKDPVTQATFARWVHTHMEEHDPILSKFVDVTPTAIMLKPGFERIAEHDTKTRFEFYRDFMRDSDTQKWLEELSDNDFPLTNRMLVPFIAFAQCKALYTHRVESLRILYMYCKENNTLPQSEEDWGFESSTTADRELLDAAVEQAESELMNLETSRKHSGDSATASIPTAASAISDLDARNGEFTMGSYEYIVEHKHITSEREKEAYDKVTSKVTLLCKDFVRKVKDIRTYNTGGKQPGMLSGKLDTKAMFRYKSSHDIFYNNTYKQLESDLAFGIVLDISGSMYGTGIENGKITMILLHEALKNLGINHAIIGHTSDGTHNVRIEKYQSFKEEAGYNTFKNYALAGLCAQWGNCDSGALYYMHHCMRRVQNKDKIILIFSDGEPTECTALELIDEVRSIEADGIKVIGIGINFPNIARYYHDYANGRNLKDMLSIVSRILQEYILKKGT